MLRNQATDLLRLEIRDNQVVHQEMLLENVARVRDVAVGPKGQLYVLLDRLHYTGGRPIFHAQTYCVEGRNHIFSTTER